MTGASRTVGLSKPSRSSVGTSPSLLQGVCHGNNEAWDRLVRLYQPKILGYCRLQGLDEASSLDVAQESFVTVYRSLASFRSNPGSGAFRAWLQTIVERRIADWYRRARRQPIALGGSSFAAQINEIAAESDGSTSGDPLQTSTLGKAFQQVAQKYESRTWQAFLRCVVDGRSTQDVADEFGMTAVGVRQLRSRILRHMRQCQSEQKR